MILFKYALITSNIIIRENIPILIQIYLSEMLEKFIIIYSREKLILFTKILWNSIEEKVSLTLRSKQTEVSS